MAEKCIIRYEAEQFLTNDAFQIPANWLDFDVADDHFGEGVEQQRLGGVFGGTFDLAPLTQQLSGQTFLSSD